MGFSGWFTALVVTIGYWGIFKKHNIKGAWALVPVVRTYIFSICANREEDGKVWSFTDFLSSVLSLLVTLQDKEIIHILPQAYTLICVFFLGVVTLNVVYGIRVFIALCEEYGQSKKWVIMWVLFSGITSIIWGYSKRYEPKTVVEIENDGAEDANLTTRVGDIDVLDKGLSIYIKQRRVRDGLNYRNLLKDIHLDIKPGRMVLLLGGSGAGKTTFLNAVNGYEKADAQIYLNGENVYKEFDRMKYEIGFVPQQDLIRYKDTVYKTLEDAAKLRLPADIGRKELKQRVESVLDIFGLLPVKNNTVEKQSGGQKKRISIATEFIADPFLFILDEPDSGLDGIMARDLMERLHAISRQGKIVIVITHTPDRVIDLFDDVIILAKDENHTGRLVYYGEIEKAKEFFGKDTMEDMVKAINRVEEGGEGKADELIKKFAEMGGANNATA